MKNLFVAAVLGGLAFACSQDSPTTPISPTAPGSSQDPFLAEPAQIDELTLDEQTARLRATLDAMSRQPQLATQEDFTCENVEEVRVRFSEPGFIDGLNVGMFAKFVGIPAGAKTLRVWWNYETAFDVYQDVVIGDGDVNPEDESRFDIEMVVEHTYTTPGEKQVRVELILGGQTGNCARNRDILVTTESFDHVASFGGLGACGLGFGMMGIKVNFNPPIPTGTSYTVRVRLDAVGTLGPVFMVTGFSNSTPTDFVFPPFQITAPPAEFTATVNTTEPHNQLLIAGNFGPPPTTSMSIRVVSIAVPGRTVGINGTLAGTCR